MAIYCLEFQHLLSGQGLDQAGGFADDDDSEAEEKVKGGKKKQRIEKKIIQDADTTDGGCSIISQIGEADCEVPGTDNNNPVNLPKVKMSRKVKSKGTMNKVVKTNKPNIIHQDKNAEMEDVSEEELYSSEFNNSRAQLNVGIDPDTDSDGISIGLSLADQNELFGTDNDGASIPESVHGGKMFSEYRSD
jgi:hypothetical protein